MILTKPLELYPIVMLNDIFKQKIVVVSPGLKKILLKKSNEEKKLLEFKVMTQKELTAFVGVEVKKTAKYYLYEKTKNYYYSKEFYSQLDKINAKRMASLNLQRYKEIKNNYEELMSKSQVIPVKEHISLNDEIYSYFVNLDFLEIQYDKIEVRSDPEAVNNSSQDVKGLHLLRFNDYYEEISYILNEVARLLSDGVDINKIRIYAPIEYNGLIKIIAKNFQIAVKGKNQYQLKSLVKIDRDELNIIDLKSMDIASETTGRLDGKILKEIVKKINDYQANQLDEKTFKDFLEYELNEVSLEDLRVYNALKIETVDNFDFTLGNKNFIIGCNNLDLIKYQKDNKFFTDELKEELLMETSLEYNRRLKKKLSMVFEYGNDLTLSYSNKVNNRQVKKSTFVAGYPVLEVNYFKKKRRFSKGLDNYYFRESLRKYKELNIENDDLEQLYINKDRFYEFRKNKGAKINFAREDLENFKLSATAMSNYFQCPFNFYAQKVLKIPTRAVQTTMLDNGNLIHYVLENVINNEVIEKFKVVPGESRTRAKFLVDRDLISEKVNFWTKKYLEDNRYLVNMNQGRKEYLVNKIERFLNNLVYSLFEQINNEEFTIYGVEKNLEMLVEDYLLVGKIDLVMRSDDNYMVLDYKTGNAELNLDKKLLNDGLELQNLIYLILLGNEEVNMQIAGTYRLKAGLKQIKRSDLGEEDFYQNLIKRSGYTNKSEDVLHRIDPLNYKGIKKDDTGKFKKSKFLIAEEEFEELIGIVHGKILEVIGVLEEDKVFDVAPLNKTDPCKHCPYKTICYKTKYSYR